MLEMNLRIAIWAFAVLSSVACVLGQERPSQSASRAQSQDGDKAAAHSATSSPQSALIKKYCTACHNQKALTAGLALDKVDPADVAGEAEIWEKVVQKLRSGAMPPASLPRPDKASESAFISSVEAALDRAAAAKPNPGRAAVHRLNRTEYANAIRDLLGIEIDERSLLPADDSGYGFDNIADVLSISPALLDRYMTAAGKISRIAIGDPKIRPAVQTYLMRHELRQDDRMSEQLPFGSRGGTAVRHYFPVDGEYLIKLRLQRTTNNSIIGLRKPNQFELRMDRKRVKVFTVGGEGPINTWYNVPNPSAYEQTADDGLEVRLPVKAGRREIGVSFLARNMAPEGALEPQLSASSFEFAQDRDREMSLGSIEIQGPFNAKAPERSPSRDRIFSCYPKATPEEEACAKKVLSGFSRRAYRRPVTDQDQQTLMAFYKNGRGKGSFDAGIELALRAILVDPDFLFRVERDPPGVTPGTAYRLSDVELASRLSFFLWSSIPDDELLDIASRGKLKDPAVLSRQVRRMLADERSRSLTRNFVGQWLYVRNMKSVAPDPGTFPDFDDNLRESFQRETELFFESQLHEDRSLLDLLTANYTFVDERLARHYGIPNVYGNTFRRVMLNDPNRNGLLGHGSVLTVTSYAHRTSPTLRGKWIMQNLLGAPPPPPPPNVPALEENAETGKSLTVRERMEQHRKNPVCASCHARMDQYGFALENFDAIGKWRSTGEGNAPVDATAILPDGTKFQGVSGLRDLLLRDPKQFAGSLTERLLTYALGRGVEYYDQPSIRKIVREAASNDYRWSSLITGIVNSTPFQMRRSQEP